MARTKTKTWIIGKANLFGSQEEIPRTGETSIVSRQASFGELMLPYEKRIAGDVRLVVSR